MNNNIDNILSDEYIIIHNEIDHYDVKRKEKLKLLENLQLIASLKIGCFISNGILINNNTYLSKIWNYYTDYSQDTLNFIKHTIDLAKNINDDSSYKCSQHINCNYINREMIFNDIKKSLIGIKCFKETLLNNEMNLLIDSIILDLEKYIKFELMKSYNYHFNENNKMLQNQILDFNKLLKIKIIDDYQIDTNQLKITDDQQFITDIINKISPRTPREINNDKITPREINNDEVTNDKITNDKITPREINNDEITPREINNDEINNDEIISREITNDQRNLSDSYFGDEVVKIQVYNLSSIEKELRNHEYLNKLRNLLRNNNNLENRTLFKSKLNQQQINHNINVVQNYIYAI